MLIQIGKNTKLGKVGAFSIPALSTCPGATEYCSKVCYARKGNFQFPMVKKSHATNLEITMTDSFVESVVNEITHKNIKVIRIHPSGDFYSKDYINKWYEIIRLTPNTRYWAYTRSWSILNLVSSLRKLSKLPNIQLWASTDPTSKSTPPRWLRLAAVDKSWDNFDESYVRCPAQKNKEITCAKCTYCFKSPGEKKFNVVFKEH